MNECLIIRISNQQGVKSFWWVWSESEQATLDKGDIDVYDDADTLVELSQNRKVYVLLSGADVNLQALELPTAKLRHLDKALPFMLEDRLADEVEDLHFSQLYRQGTKVYTAITDKDWFASLLEQFKTLGIKLTNVLPEILALPNDGLAHGIRLGDEWILRQGAWTGTTIPDAWLEHYLPKPSESPEQDERLVVHSQMDESLAMQPLIQYQPGDELTLLASGTIAARSTLLSGEFKPQSSGVQYWRIWRKSVYALLVLMILWGAKISLETAQLNQQVAALHQESERIFHTIFPAKKKIPTTSYLKRQFNNELAVLSGGAQGKTVLTIFEHIAQALKNKQHIKLESFSYDASRSEVKVDFKGDDFNAFEATRVALEAEFHVQQGPLNKSNDQVYGSYILTEK